MSSDTSVIFSTQAPNELGDIPPEFEDIVPSMIDMAARKAGVAVNIGGAAHGVKKTATNVLGGELEHTQIEFTPAQLGQVLRALFASGQHLPVMLWGPPGIGKSSIVWQAANDLNLEVVDLRLSQLGPTDLRGLPAATEDRTAMHYLPPIELPTKGRGVLFLDEINMAPPVMMGMAQQLILDRKVGSYTLPDGWLVVAAGNRKVDKAAVSSMPTPVANRMTHWDIVPSASDWAAYVTKSGTVDPVIIGYVLSQYKGGAGSGDSRSWAPLLDMPADGASRFASPRSWEMASKLLALGLPVGPAVGEAHAAGLKVFLNRYSKIAADLRAGKPVQAAAGDGLIIAWMVTALKSKSKITFSGGGKGDFEQVLASVKELVS